MADHMQFSDDFSALWGPGDDGVLVPERPNRPNRPSGDGPSPGGEPQAPDPDRLAALEKEVRRLQDVVASLEKAGSEAVQQRAQDGATTMARLARFESRMSSRLTDLAQRLAEVAASTAAVAAQVARAGAGDERGMARPAEVHAAEEAHTSPAAREAEPPGKHWAWRVRREA